MNKTMMLGAGMLALSSAAQAGELNQLRPYVGVDATRVMADYESTQVGGIGYDDLLEDSLNAVSPYVGVQLHERVGVELSYLRSENGKKSDVLGSGIDTKTRVSGFGADVVGNLPMSEDGRLALLGSAGIGRYTANVETSGAVASEDDENDIGYRLGAGLQYQMTDNWGVRAMARYIKVDFDDTTDNLVTASVGVNYKF